MRCVKCGRELDQGALFCPFCGEKVPSGGQVDNTPLYQCEVRGLLRSGQLIVYRDRTEFVLSRVQKMVLPYESLVSLKKGMDRISFIMEDARTESCTVNRKNLHEAFYTIEQASRPYLARRKERLAAQGIRYSFPSSPSGLGGVLSSGLLNILDDRVEYLSPAGKGETVSYQDVKAARISQVGALELALYDGSRKAYTVDKELREELAAFLQEALRPFIEKRKAELLARGIYFSFLSSQGFSKGTLDVYDRRLVFTAKAGQEEATDFQDIRAFSVSDGTLTVDLTNAVTRTYTVDKESQEELSAFLDQAVSPYIEDRTKGFDLCFGMNERLEINQARGLFHILRQGGREITPAYSLDGLLRAEAVETQLSRDAVSTFFAINGNTAPPGREERFTALTLRLTVRTEEGQEELPVRFTGMTGSAGRSGPAYGRCMEDLERLFSFLEERVPACERILPPPPAEETAPEEAQISEAVPVETESEEADSAPAPVPADSGPFGALIGGISDFVEHCATPMTVAIQGDWESGSGGFLHMVYRQLGARDRSKVFWLSTWQFSQFDLGEQLPSLLADKLIELLGGGVNEEAKTRARALAQGVIGIASGLISQGTSDGQKLSEALFRDNLAGSLEQKRKLFSELVSRRAGGGKVILFVDDLTRLPPSKVVGLLEALRSFFDTPGCIFMASVDRETVLRGKEELSGPDYSVEKGNAYFDRLFKTAFRVPKGSMNVRQYVRDNLVRTGIPTGDEAEILHYGELAGLSVGGDPKALERLFNSLLLVKSLAGEELYGLREGRLSLFALLCMQSSFPGAYRCLVRRKDRIAPELILSLTGASPLEEEAGLTEEERQRFRAFAGELCAALDADGTGCLTQAECAAFAKALAVSAITSM